jgi:hypothetical protein
MITRLGTYAQIKGSSYLLPCNYATTENIVLSGSSTEESPVIVDGGSVEAGMRVLVKNQDFSSENGIYIVSSGTWSRAIDMSTQDDLIRGQQVYIEFGDENERKIYRLDYGILDEDIVFEQNLFIYPRPYTLEETSEYYVDDDDRQRWLLISDSIGCTVYFDNFYPDASEFIITQASSGQLTFSSSTYSLVSPTETFTTRTLLSTIFAKVVGESILFGGDLT